MLKVFLVEDENIVRENLRDSIMWQQYGYQFAGEASDGEMALPLIRKVKPDVLITDIKMPFMDGLALSGIVSQEFPQMKIIIISGYSEFEYARQAIRAGVEQYILKPVTRSSLQKALQEIRDKIENEREQENYLEKFKEDMQEYEQFSRRIFFEKVFEGQLSVQEIYEEAQKLSLEMDAAFYNLAMVSLREKRNTEERSQESRLAAGKREEITRYFLRYPEFLIFRWNVNTYGILIKGEEEQMEELKNKCQENIIRICSGNDEELEWCCAIGEPVERLSLLPQVYSKVNHMMSCRFLRPSQHILTMQTAEFVPQGGESLEDVDIAKMDPEVIKNFLENGQVEEIEDFVDGYLESQKDALESKIFRDYLMLSIRFTAISFVEKLGYTQKELLENTYTDHMQILSLNVEDMRFYMLELLGRALELSNRVMESQSKKMIKRAMAYIEENYANESISLNEVAGAVEVSANYFSTVFRQEMEMTFTEYVTQKRMERAKVLLRQTERQSGDIAAEVGFKDPHYFSFVFKKTQGCTPREYRSGIKP